MEGTMAEIRCFAADFAPRNWAFCNGQVLSINTNQALFALLGTTYGGNGIQTFGLPDLRGRIPVGWGQGVDADNYILGQTGGEEAHTLLTTEMPIHNHGVTITAGTGPATASATLYGTNVQGTLGSSASALFGGDDGNQTLTIYATGGSIAPMANSAITLSNITTGSPTVSLNTNGGSQPHSNIQPVLGMNYIICLMGVFPSRN